MADWIQRLKKSASKYIKNKHSKAGKEHLDYEKAVKRFSKDLQQDNPQLNKKQIEEIARDELSGAYEKREARKRRERKFNEKMRKQQSIV